MCSILFGQGVQLEDFYLIYNLEQKIVGIYSLWNQKSSKQTRVVHYSWPVKWMRPFLSCICIGARSHAAAENCPRFRLFNAAQRIMSSSADAGFQRPALPCGKLVAALSEACVLRDLGE
jgi:hypothetical protein